jgi:hypothetical protein
MMSQFNRTLMVCFLTASFSSVAFSDSGRCGSHVIDEGMHKSQVLAYCGEPTFVSGMKWTYERGKDQFTMIVRFYSDDTVDRVEVESID